MKKNMRPVPTEGELEGRSMLSFPYSSSRLIVNGGARGGGHSVGGNSNSPSSVPYEAETIVTCPRSSEVNRSARDAIIALTSRMSSLASAGLCRSMSRSSLRVFRAGS